jgi:putative endonuclease
MKAFFYVYILVSEANETIHYTGIASKFKERLLEHNRRACAHTSKYRPWRVETAIAFKSERYLKTGSGREFARRHF